MIILDREGSLKYALEYGSISLDERRCASGELPYFALVSNISEIICCADGLFGRKTYMAWHNVLRASCYEKALIGCDRRNLATSELEQIDRYLWRVF